MRFEGDMVRERLGEVKKMSEWKEIEIIGMLIVGFGKS